MHGLELSRSAAEHETEGRHPPEAAVQSRDLEAGKPTQSLPPQLPSPYPEAEVAGSSPRHRCTGAGGNSQHLHHAETTITAAISCGWTTSGHPNDSSMETSPGVPAAKSSRKRLQINPANWEDLVHDRPTWRRAAKTGAAIYEANRIATAKAKGEARKSQLRLPQNANAQPPPARPRRRRTFVARIGLVSSSPPPKKTPRISESRQQASDLTKRRQDWCRWPVCPEYRRTGVCPALPEEKNGCVVGCQLAHIRPEEPVSVTSEGYARICFDSMGLLQTLCSRPSCNYFHPPKHIRNQIIARRHAQYLREKQTREAEDFLATHSFSLLMPTAQPPRLPPSQENRFPTAPNLQDANSFQLAGSSWGLGSLLPLQTTLGSNMIQTHLSRMTPPAAPIAVFPSTCQPNSSHLALNALTDLALPVNFPALPGYKQLSACDLGALDLQRLYMSQLLQPAQLFQSPPVWPGAAPEMTAPVADAACYSPTDLLSLLNWLTLSQSLMSPASTQPLPATAFPFTHGLAPLLHTNAEVALSSPGTQQQQQQPQQIPQCFSTFPPPPPPPPPT
nr:unnamed protein product [Spirometra erinaceieuropaei]